MVQQPWKLHWQVGSDDCDCCGDEGCNLFVPCCVNSLRARWEVRSLDAMQVEIFDGITLSAHVENLCDPVNGVGDDWSQYNNVSGQYFKQPATSVGTTLQSIISDAGCLMNMAVEPRHVVCPCPPQIDNFKLCVTLHNCDQFPVSWDFVPRGTELCFSLGNILASPPLTDDEIYGCCLPVRAYQIDGGVIIRSLPDQDDPVVLNVDGEGDVELCIYFGPDLGCVQCLDDSVAPGASVIAVPFSGVPPPWPVHVEGTPKKPCLERSCGQSMEGTVPGLTPVVYADCAECSPAPFLVRFDDREHACANCYWGYLELQGWENAPGSGGDPKNLYGIDSPPCPCGCPQCSQRRTAVDCVPPATLGPQRSDTGSETICAGGPGWVNGGDNLIWHGVIPDGCVGTSQEFNIFSYRGPCGIVNMSQPDMTMEDEDDFLDWLATQVGCESFEITWDTSAPDMSGAVTVSMSINGFPASRVYPAPTCSASRDIIWKRDFSCGSMFAPRLLREFDKRRPRLWGSGTRRKRAGI